MGDDPWVKQRSWPERYEVTLTGPDGETASFTVATWEGSEKAELSGW